jgi:uncharacterized membrane protein YeiH
MMILGGDQAISNALTEFKSYAASTLLVLDVTGTFVFALSGAVAGVRERLDVFGVLVVSFAAASAGGIMRDVLIGSLPPAAIADWRYLAVSLIAGLLVFVFYPHAERLRRLHNHVLVFDAAGLALFAVAGTQKAIGFGLNPVMAALLGMLSGIGGGMLRDVLISQIPTVLKAELYAVAALAGAAVVVTGHMLGFPPTSTAIIGAGICFGIRMVAIRRRWQLPVAGVSRRGKAKADKPTNDNDPGAAV